MLLPHVLFSVGYMSPHALPLGRISLYSLREIGYKYAESLLAPLLYKFIGNCINSLGQCSCYVFNKLMNFMYSKELIQAPLLAYLANLIIKVITFKINVIIDITQAMLTILSFISLDSVIFSPPFIFIN